jgi:hypothetical protein
MKAIYVKWKDACSYDSHDHEKTDFDNDEVRSVYQDSIGWLLKDDKEGVVMTRDLRTQDGLVSNSLCVPKAYIVRKKTWNVNID